MAMCGVHQALNAIRTEDTGALYLIAGLCTGCGRPNPTGGWRCRGCQDRSNESRRTAARRDRTDAANSPARGIGVRR
jgi:hypothetical protein